MGKYTNMYIIMTDPPAKGGHLHIYTELRGIGIRSRDLLYRCRRQDLYYYCNIYVQLLYCVWRSSIGIVIIDMYCWTLYYIIIMEHVRFMRTPLYLFLIPMRLYRAMLFTIFFNFHISQNSRLLGSVQRITFIQFLTNQRISSHNQSPVGYEYFKYI